MILEHILAVCGPPDVARRDEAVLQGTSVLSADHLRPHPKQLRMPSNMVKGTSIPSGAYF